MFRSGDREEVRKVQHEHRDILRACKDTYRRKVGAKFQQNVRDVQTGMKPIIRCKVLTLQSSDSLERVKEPSVVSLTPRDPHTPSLPHMLPPLPPHSPDVSSPVQHLSSSSFSSTQDTSTLPRMTVGPSTQKRSFVKTHTYCIVFADRPDGS